MSERSDGEFSAKPLSSEGGYSEKPLGSSMRDVHEESLPSLANKDGSSGLSNLGQAARLKKIHSARNLLIVVGILQIGFSILELTVLLPNQIAEIRRQPGMVVDEAAVNLLRMVIMGFVGAGIAFVVMGLVVKQYPLPISISAMIVFIGIILVSAAINPATLAQGWILKIIFISCIVSAIKAASAYQNFKEEGEPLPERA